VAGADRPVVWSPEAEEDLIQLWLYLAQEASKGAADRRLRNIERACARLSQWPQSGRARDELLPGLRSIPAPPQVIFYRVSAAAVEIVRVLHGNRDIDAIFGKPEL
jgi:toxin ParE1/3/4